ncbi:uncharacterized protein LOC119858955 [Dermochelys coriacea]|uniref:uncharacterized protein LOC119858955 n=1 Tax=Dermochelys coriacea TaxID=27794 RepID=UPI0018E8917D|nr:uncharacterized protein LOC119858955 [Dermochelys coriacea]
MNISLSITSSSEGKYCKLSSWCTSAKPPPKNRNCCCDEGSQSVAAEEAGGDQEEERGSSAKSISAPREFSSTPSQELFFTLDLVPSQPTEGRLRDLEGGEGTSAANVSSLHVSSPSQRLSKIRSRKKRTRDEMFSELMQSSHAERAQHNAWRETMSESRKAQNEREQRRDEQEERRQDVVLRLLEAQTDKVRCMVEVQEKQQEHRPLLQPLSNQPPSSPSSIAPSRRCPRMRWGGLQAPNHAMPPQRTAQATESWHSISFEVQCGLVLLSSPPPPPHPVLSSSRTPPGLPWQLSPHLCDELIKNA